MAAVAAGSADVRCPLAPGIARGKRPSPDLGRSPSIGRPPIPPGGHADVTFVTGYGAAADVPEDLVQALKRLVLAAYRREAGEALPDEVSAILAARRERRL